MDGFAAYQATAYSTRDQLIDQWNSTQLYLSSVSPKRVYYLSLEFLIGRSMDNALLNLGVKDTYNSAIGKLGFNLEDLVDEETDAALGNGGLGRLAACFMGKHTFHIIAADYLTDPISLSIIRFSGYSRLSCMGIWNSIQLRNL